MSRRISLLVALISTAIVVSFVIPLLLLVQTLAEDRGTAVATQQANGVAILVGGLHDDPRLADLLQPTLAGSPARTTVVLADGTVLGDAWPEAASDPAYQRARTGQAFTVRDREGVRVYVPMLVDGGAAVTRATMTSAQLAEGVPLAWASIIALGLLLTGLAVVVAAQAGRRISRPLLEVAGTAHRLRQGELDARAPLAGTPETVELGAALNGLADRIGHLLIAERDNVAGLAHRLRTPVTALRLEAEGVADPAAAASLGQLIGELQAGIDEVVRDAQRPVREDLPGTCDAVGVVADRLAHWGPLAEDQGRAVNTELPGRPVVVGLSALELQDVVDILLDNVFAHTPEGTGFAVRLGVDASGAAVLTVTDEGPGFTGLVGPPRLGTSGHGLRLARRMLERGGGSLVASPPGTPGAVTVTLPSLPRP